MANMTLYTTASFFDLIIGQLKEEGKIPDILEYALSTHEPRELRNYEFDVLGQVNFGCEGIYLDLYFKGNIGDGREEQIGAFGTIKTLREDDESFRTMAILGANFQLAAHHFINKHLDDFTHIGYDIDFLREDGSVATGCTHKGVKSFDEAKQYAKGRMVELNKWYGEKESAKVTSCRITENSSGKEMLVQEEELSCET